MYKFFFLPFVLRALCFSSQNYKHIRIYPVRATFPALLAPKLCTNFFFSHSCYVLFASRPKIINAFVFFPLRATFSTLPVPIMYNFFLQFLLRALCFLSQYYKRIRIYPYVLRSVHFSPQNYVQFFFLPFVLRALCFSSQNYKSIRIYPVRATLSTLLAPKLYISPVRATCSLLL